jgi:hypothetical protein
MPRDQRIPVGAQRWRIAWCGPKALDAAIPQSDTHGYPGDIVQDTRPGGLQGVLLAVFQTEPLTTVFGVIEDIPQAIPVRHLAVVERRRAPEQAETKDAPADQRPKDIRKPRGSRKK